MSPDEALDPIDERAADEADIRDNATIWRDALAKIIEVVEAGHEAAYTRCATADEAARTFDQVLDRVRAVASGALQGVVVELARS